jgi:flagellar biosynthetic protein FliR
MAAPVMVTLLLVDMLIGVVSRMMPSINAYFTLLPVKMALSLAVVALSLPVVAYLLEQFTARIDNELHQLLAAMGRA